MKDIKKIIVFGILMVIFKLNFNINNDFILKTSPQTIFTNNCFLLFILSNICKSLVHFLKY